MGDLRVRLLGGLEVEGRAETEVGSRKARTLLKALAVARGRPVGGDVLADAVWGEQLPSRPAEQVGVLVSRLRGALGGDRIVRSDAGYALRADWLDVEELERQLLEAREHLAAGDPGTARVHAAVALALARGPLLPDEDGDWVTGPRAVAERMVASARRVAATASLELGDDAAAIEAAGAAIDADAYDEEALRLLMRAHAAAGRPGAALAAYAVVRARLAEDLGVSPDPATEALHGAILRSTEDGKAEEPTRREHSERLAPDTTRRWLTDHPDAVATLRTAAVLGDPVDVDLLAAPDVTGAPVPALLAHLDAALAAGLLRDDAGGVAFAGPDVRDQMAEGTSAARTRHLHLAAARVIAARPNADPLTVARHAEAGDDLPLAAAQLAAAAERARLAGDLATALALADRAVELDDAVPIRLARARVRLSALELPGARADVDLAVERGGGAPALELAGWVAYYQRDLPAARLRAEEGAHRATDPATLAGCRALTGRIRHSLGELDAAEADLRQAAEAPTLVRGVAEIWLADVLNHRGDPAAAADAAERGLLDRSALQHPFGVAHGWFARAHSLGQRGQIAATRRSTERWLAELAAMGVTGLRYLPLALNVQGWALRWSGRADEARERNEEALATVAAAHHEEPRNHALLDLTEGALLAGDLDRAASLLADVRLVDDEQGTMVWHQRQRLWLVQARLASVGGDADSAVELAETLVQDATRRGSRRAELLGRAASAIAAARAGRSIDLDATAAVLDELEQVAGMEAWRITAEAAAAAHVDAWWGLARRRAASAVAAAEDDGDVLARWIDRELERLV